MKSRELHTIHDLIASNYVITKLSSGLFLHQFTPATTATVYEFESDEAAPVITVGERYNIGFSVNANNQNIVNLSTLSLTSEVNPMLSLVAAKQMSKINFDTEKEKNDSRVTHSAIDGYYWGKKYAWRMFGIVIAKDAFYAYLDEIRHKSVPCITRDPELPHGPEHSVAYAEEGLEAAILNLIQTSVKVSAAYFKSPLYSKKFSIKGINALTDKK